MSAATKNRSALEGLQRAIEGARREQALTAEALHAVTYVTCCYMCHLQALTAEALHGIGNCGFEEGLQEADYLQEAAGNLQLVTVAYLEGSTWLW